MSKRLLLLPCLLMLAALSLTACGGGGDSSGSTESGSASSSDPATAAVQTAIEESIGSSDPEKCSEFQTAVFNEQGTHETGAAAFKACQTEAESGEGVSQVSVLNVSVNGTEASAEAVPSGGLFDGQTLAVAVVKEGDQWKVNEFTGFANYDAKSLEAAFGEKLKETGELSDSQVSCVAEGVGKSTQEEAEELLLSGSSAPFIKLAAACAKA